MLAYLKTHLFYVIIIAIGLVAFRSWLQEHDARVLAEQTVKQSELKVSDLTTQIKLTSDAAASAQAALQKRVAEVRTPSQAIAAIPDVSTLPLNTRPAPGLPGGVIVDAVPLFQSLAQCKSDAIELTACRTNFSTQEKIIAEKDTQIKALTAKPRFWKRFGNNLLKYGGPIAGYLIGKGVI